MMPFFFIAGISPKIKKLDNTPRQCPLCGLKRAYYTRVDHYLTLFFIPLFRVKTGAPVIMCDQCKQSMGEFKADIGAEIRDQGLICNHCAKPLHSDFIYCPHCGKRV